MQYKTFGELKLKVQRETDTEAEDFVTPEEIQSYFQDAVNECEAHIHKMGLDNQYFLSRQKYDLVIDQQELEFPANIYATKILRMVYAGESKIYDIQRMKNRTMFTDIAEYEQSRGKNDLYRYIILNTTPNELPVIELWPKAWQAGTNVITMYYIRSAIEIVDDDSPVDIPEFYSFICAYVKWKIYGKEGTQKEDIAKVDLDRERELMLATLAEQTPDEDNKIEPDLSTYEEMT